MDDDDERLLNNEYLGNSELSIYNTSEDEDEEVSTTKSNDNNYYDSNVYGPHYDDHVNSIDKKENSNNIVLKLINRERTGYFSNSPRKKIKEIPFKNVPERLRFRLMDIVPFCYMNNHIFMGLSACGQFLLSYTIKSNDDDTDHMELFHESYKYELYFWIYRPHNLLVKYYNVCLFDDHGVNSVKNVTMTQWPSNPRTLIVHGSNNYDNEHSYISILSVPKLGCLDCKRLRDEHYPDFMADFNRSAALCIKCNMTIHTKYCHLDSDPKFDPKVNLSCPERIIIVANGLIHMLSVRLEMNKQLKHLSNALNVFYINGIDKINNFDTIDNNPIMNNHKYPQQQQQHQQQYPEHQQLPHQQNQSESYNRKLTKSSTNLDTLIDRNVNSNTTNNNNNNNTDNNFPTTDKLTNDLLITQTNGCETKLKEVSIIDRIIADFTECETEYIEKYPKIEKNVNKTFDELVIVCNSSSTTNNNTNNYKDYDNRGVSTTNSIKTTIDDKKFNTNGKTNRIGLNNKNQSLEKINNNTNNNNSSLNRQPPLPPPPSPAVAQTRVRLLSYPNNRLTKKNLYPLKYGGNVTTVELNGSSTTYAIPSTFGPTTISNNNNNSNSAGGITSINNKISDKAAKAYEFSEDNEKCEKISLFRKRRLADKKYEFSEDNSENIMPFRKHRSVIASLSSMPSMTSSASASSLSALSPSTSNNSSIKSLHSKYTTTTRNTPSSSSSASSIIPSASTTASAMSPGCTNNYSTSYYNNSSNSNFELTSHTHRASPNHGFRSPCGSPVGYRFMKSPPTPGRSPFYLSVSASSPRQTNRRYAADLIDNLPSMSSMTNSIAANFLLSPRSDDCDFSKSHHQHHHSSASISNVKLSPSMVNTLNCDNTMVDTLKAGERNSIVTEAYEYTKCLVRRYVEEDDATSVITSEEDDCISPGFHTSLPFEVHGACYSDMQMISNITYQKLKCPTAILTQHTFDLEAFILHVATHVCDIKNIKYGFVLDWACEILNVCALSCSLTLILFVYFSGKPTCSKEICRISQNGIENCNCNLHINDYECRSLFTWNFDSGEYEILDYGDLRHIPLYKRNTDGLKKIVKSYANELLTTSNDDTKNNNLDIFNTVRILNSCTKKSKEILSDYINSIEFYRYNNANQNNNNNNNTNIRSTSPLFSDDSNTYYFSD